MKRLDGTLVAEKIRETLRDKVSILARRKPLLVIVWVGTNRASETYIRAKEKACHGVGIAFALIHLNESITSSALLEHIRALNQRPDVDAILVQLPLPPHIDTDRAIQTIDPTKDVDGLHPINQGKLLLGDPSGFCPCTPAGILALLSHYKIDPQGKHVVIAGRSNIVGKPLAALLMQKRAGCNATVTLIHSASTHIEHLTKEADILIIAIGKRHWLKAPMVKEGAIVIDVGINQDEKPNIVGDVDFDNVAPKCAWITPVPGGVGPMTIAMLMHNTVRSYENRLL